MGQLPPPQISPQLNPSCHIPVPITACTCPPVWPLIGFSVPPGDKGEPDSKAKSAKSTKKEPMSMFQVNGEKKEKKNKKKGTGTAGKGGGSQSCFPIASP